MSGGVDKLDKNMKTETNVEGFVFYDATEKPFTMYGTHKEEGADSYVRMPTADAQKVSSAVYVMNRYPSGGRIRFKTDAEKLAVKCFMSDWHGGCNSSMFSRTGFDFFSREDGEYIYIGAVSAPLEYTGGAFEVVANLKKSNAEMRDITMYMPIANPVADLYIGIPEGASLEVADEYTCPLKPVVYYGSSITMGMGASRPGTIYQGSICRRFDWDFINLGFSGNAKGEPAIAEYIASLDMSVFVLDYDHNSPNPEHLKETQMAFYETVRKAQPDLPIIMCSRPVANLKQGDDEARFNALWDNYQKALSGGDKNLYFIKGFEMFLPGMEQDSLADGCHPNDIGYFGMGKKIGDLLADIKKTLDKS